MRRISAASVLGLSVVLLALACSSDSPTLQLSTGPITEKEFRTQVLQVAFARAPVFDVLCSAAPGLPPEELLEAYNEMNVFAGESPPSAPSAEDAARAAEILIEECEDLT